MISFSFKKCLAFWHSLDKKKELILSILLEYWVSFLQIVDSFTEKKEWKNNELILITGPWLVMGKVMH